MSQATKARTPTGLYLIGVMLIVGGLGVVWTKLDTKKTPAPVKPTSSTQPDKLVLRVLWKKHNWGGTGLATFNTAGFEEEVELYLPRGGTQERTVMNPLGQGAAEYSVHVWNPTEGFVQCEIRYTAPDGLEHFITTAYTNFGGAKTNFQANILCATSVADIKGMAARGFGK